MHTYLLAHPSLWQFLVGALFLFFRVLAAADLSDIEKLLARTVAECLTTAVVNLSPKEAAAMMRTDYTRFLKALKGEPDHFINLTKLLRLPLAFWVVFAPKLIAIVFQQRMQEMWEGLTDVKRSA